MANARLTVKTYERGTPYPVVSHTFTGRSRQEAAHYLRSHMKTDAFLRGCSRGKWKSVVCRNVKRWGR